MMTPLPTQCPKCDGAFVHGYQIDTIPGGYQIPSWVPGMPKWSWLRGLSLPASYERIPMAALRCESCGYIEFYARPEFKEK